MTFRILSFNAPPGWGPLTAILSKNQSKPLIVAKLIDQLQALGAVSALVDDEYIDRDFSEAYSAYYAKTFRRHSKICTRILFFASDISFLNTTTDVVGAAELLQQQPFLGQVILRPISRAPLGMTVLRPPPLPAGFEGHLLVRGIYDAHVFGAELSVEAIPMTQQDSRIGACAQASIWVAARHFHAKHRGPWLSTVAITEAAIANSEFAVNLVLPAGSEFLTPNNMVAALRAAGREPLIYAARQDPNPGSVTPNWGKMRPADVINRYVDSGIPVIVGLTFPGQDIGHAVVATGQILRDNLAAALPASNPTRAEFCEAFYANDDQIGANIRVPVNGNGQLSDTPYSVNNNAIYLIIPLPSKVYLPAEEAEVIAWDGLRSYASDWSAFRQQHSTKLGSSETLGDAFVADIGANRVISRTYLTYGWKYKQRAVRNRFSNAMRQVIRNLELPRYVYVTEFSTLDDLVTKSQYNRRVTAHVVVDATAKRAGSGNLNRTISGFSA